MKSVQLYLYSSLAGMALVLTSCGQVQQESSQIADEPPLSRPVQSLAVGDLVWARQFGTPSEGAAYAVTSHAAGVYVVGYTSGAFPSQSSSGASDVFVRKYDTKGNAIWTRQFGSSSFDRASAASSDATGVYVAGETHGVLPGQSSAGWIAAFVRKYDSSGNAVWTRQFGTSSYTNAFAVSSDITGVYVAGRTWDALPDQQSAGLGDAFVRKYDPYGNEVWTRQFGTSEMDHISAVSSNTAGVYVAGETQRVLPGQSSAGWIDAFVRKYDSNGNEVWTRQFGSTGYDIPQGIANTTTGIYVAGYTSETFPGQTSAGGEDAFVRKLDSSGNTIWTRQFGTSSSDQVKSVSGGITGVYIAGWTDGTLEGQTSSGYFDAFVREYDFNGDVVWTRQFGTSNLDFVQGASVNTTGIYVVGYTYGTFPAQFKVGYHDPFLVKLVSSPASSIHSLLNFFDNAVAGGTLVGSGPGNSASGRLMALRNMLIQASAQFEAGHTAAACQQLRDAYKHADGLPRPPDFVVGPAAPVLAQMVQAVIGQACPDP